MERNEVYVIGEVFLTPLTNVIIPPFSSKVGRTILGDPKDVVVSPLKRNGKYLIKHSSTPTFLELEAGEVYSFEVGGEEKSVIKELSKLEDNYSFFNTYWKIVDVKLQKVVVNKSKKIRLEILTPALIVNPYVKAKRKVFTNKSSFVFFVNLLDVTGFSRNDERTLSLLKHIDEALWEEPSIMKYEKVIYDGKEIIGMTGLLNYSIEKDSEIVYEILENAIAKGIGSSRRIGFGRVKITVE
ncbi:CRISPR-associated endoribonuclease Cas6 [Sulfurisphaera javensis]|uniref:CRISPR-associated endoribonuclease Cas6 n=1 Tax=Sulfurisphaera javensis TaxID=2049879 RepID=A0AAT9GV41_9CREN